MDIGSDHGYVPLDLLESGRIKSAFVTDVNEAPLQRCLLSLSRFAKEGRVGHALSDGFAGVPSGVYDAAAICGMGGELIARIIAEGGEKARVPLILQPNTKFAKLRASLWRGGYTIKTELYPTEGKRAYLVMLAVYTGHGEAYTAVDAYFGKLKPFDKGYAAFVRAELSSARKRLHGALIEGDAEAAEREGALIAAAEALLRR